MENSGLISVIIPVYNVEKYLRECVDSVLNQTYTNYEIILVDDGSTDSSGAICDEYAEEYDNVTVIHKENSGPSETRNAGISVAKGEYIYFLDSDDYIVPHTFEKLVETSEKQNSDIVFFDAVSFVDNKPDVHIKQGYKREYRYESDTGLSVFSKLNANKEFKCAVYLMLIRKRLITDNEISFCEDAYMSEDLLFTFQLYCLAERVSQCSESLYYRRYRDNSIITSGRTQRHFLSCIIIYSKVKEFYYQKGLQNNPCVNEFVVRCAFNALDIYGKMSTTEKNDNKNLYDELKNEILADNAYGDKALKMRCYGKVFWFVYKVYEKTIGRIFV